MFSSRFYRSVFHRINLKTCRDLIQLSKVRQISVVNSSSGGRSYDRRRRFWVIGVSAVASSVSLASPPSGEDKLSPEAVAVAEIAKMDIELKMLIRKAAVAEKYAEKVELLHEALLLIGDAEKDGYLKDHLLALRLSYVLCAIGACHFAANEYKAAEKSYLDCMRIGSQGGVMSPQDAAFVEISHKLAVTYAIQGLDAKAEQGYEYSIHMARHLVEDSEKKRENEDLRINLLALLGICLDGYGRYLVQKGRLKKAEPLLREALGISVKILGSDSPQTQVIRSAVAKVLAESGRFSEAVRVLDEAILNTRSLATSNEGDLCVYLLSRASARLMHAEELMKKNPSEREKTGEYLREVSHGLAEAKKLCSSKNCGSQFAESLAQLQFLQKKVSEVKSTYSKSKPAAQTIDR